jgi:hypothetical protein
MAGGENWELVVVGRSLGYQTDGSTATELLSQCGPGVGEMPLY